MDYNKSGLQMCFEYDELLELREHLPSKSINLINKLECAIKDLEEIDHLNNIALLYEMYEN